jgi:dTDP-4-amino-4,6-dideoxygalactose transaminase
VIIVVHLAGQSSDMQAIKKLSDEYGFKIIEDASHAIGGKYQNTYIGNCQYSDITIFSFHPVKIITTGEGGMAVTNQKSLEKKMRLLRSHGITRDVDDFVGESKFSWSYEQQLLGFNYRLTDIQAALGISQMNSIDDNISARRSIAKVYDQALSSLPLVLPWQHADSYSSYHLYIIKIDKKKTTCSREWVFNFLRDSNVGVNVHYIPIHTQPYYRALGFSEADYPNAMEYYENVISLPIFPALTESDQLHVINALIKSFESNKN